MSLFQQTFKTESKPDKKWSLSIGLVPCNSEAPPDLSKGHQSAKPTKHVTSGRVKSLTPTRFLLRV